jgi:hypothetical protein
MISWTCHFWSAMGILKKEMGENGYQNGYGRESVGQKAATLVFPETQHPVFFPMTPESFRIGTEEAVHSELIEMEDAHFNNPPK